MFLGASIVIVKGLVALMTSPLQPVKVWPAAGVAVRVTDVPGA